MDSSALVSVIMPVYKVEDYLDRAVRSVVDQSYGNLEIILVDDGSPDRCPAICDSWAKQDPRIRVIHKKNGGVSSARNAGLRMAGGEWISFVDSDDWLHPQFFELLIAEGMKHQANVVSAEYVKTADETEPNEIQDQTLVAVSVVPKEYNYWKNRFFVWGKIYRRTLLDGLRFDESLSYGEDVCYNLQLLYQPDIRVVEIKTVLYYYRIRIGSLASGNRAMKRIALCSTVLSYAEKEVNENRKTAYIVYAIKRGLSTRFDVRGQKDCRIIKKQCNEVISFGLRKYRQISSFSLEEYVKYCVFFQFPSVYSMFRFVNDPSLLLKKSEKKKRKDSD